MRDRLIDQCVSLCNLSYKLPIMMLYSCANVFGYQKKYYRMLLSTEIRLKIAAG